MSQDLSSRIPGFYELSLQERLSLSKKFAEYLGTPFDEPFKPESLSSELTDVFIENAIGSFALPLGVATNFTINGKDILIPMAVEESSVLAAASYGAKLARAGGGFKCSVSKEFYLSGQIQFFVPEAKSLEETQRSFDTFLRAEREQLLAVANKGQNRLMDRGGGAKEIDGYVLDEGRFIVFSIHVDTVDAMGANIVNTMCERVAHYIRSKNEDWDVGLRILSNLCDQRIAEATCLVPWTTLNSNGMDGKEAARRIVEAYRFADLDIYRACTHNKGVMNGMDSVCIATGNDWRALEAGAHAYAAISGRYKPLTQWKQNDKGDLEGRIEVAIAVGVVGGVTKLHPTARFALALMGRPNARELSQIMAAAGLAQNLSALKALATEGIQRGHMSLHKKNIDYLQTLTPMVAGSEA